MATKIAIQRIYELGVELCDVQILVENTLGIGHNTCQNDAQKGQSVGVTVVSMNRTFTKYLPVPNFQTNPS